MNTNTGVIDGSGTEVTDKDEAIEGLSRTIHILYAALSSSNGLLKESLADHMEAAHGGDHDAMCGMKIQIEINDGIELFVANRKSVHEAVH